MLCNSHHQAAQAKISAVSLWSTSITAGSTVTKASSLTKTKAFSLKSMLVLLVSPPGACPGLQTPSPSRTPTRPSAPDAWFCNSLRILGSSTFFAWKSKVWLDLVCPEKDLKMQKESWACSDEVGVNCELGQTEVIAVLCLLLLDPTSHKPPFSCSSHVFLIELNFSSLLLG